MAHDLAVAVKLCLGDAPKLLGAPSGAWSSTHRDACCCCGGGSPPRNCSFAFHADRLSAADAAASVRREATLHRRLQGERRIAVLQQSANNPGESYDFLSHKLNSDWELPFESLLPDAFADGALEGVEVLLIPHCTFATVFQALGAEGRSAIAQWVESGGHVVGWQCRPVLALHGWHLPGH